MRHLHLMFIRMYGLLSEQPEFSMVISNFLISYMHQIGPSQSRRCAWSGWGQIWPVLRRRWRPNTRPTRTLWASSAGGFRRLWLTRRQPRQNWSNSRPRCQMGETARLYRYRINQSTVYYPVCGLSIYFQFLAILNEMKYVYVTDFRSGVSRLNSPLPSTVNAVSLLVSTLVLESYFFITKIFVISMWIILDNCTCWVTEIKCI